MAILAARMRVSFTVFLVALAVAGCGAATRKPLISFDSSPSRPRPQPRPDAGTMPLAQQPPSQQPIVLRPAAQPLVADPGAVASASATREEIESLIARLRGGKTGERKQVLDRLVALGESARADLERALEDVTFEGDVLHEALDRVREKDPARAPEVPGLGPERKHAVASPWVEAKYRLALEKFLAGDDLGAQQLVEAILTVEPATTARPRLERLKKQIRDHLISETVIATTIVLEDRVLSPSRKLRAKVLLENKTREDVVLRQAAGSPLGHVVLDYEELQPDGTRALRRSTRPVKVGSLGLRLDAHAKQEITLDLPTEHASKPKGVLGRYRLSGRLRPYTLLAGEEPLPYFLPLPLVEIVVLDDDDKTTGEKPDEAFAGALKDIQGAVEARSDAELDRTTRAAFTAALVWASQDRDAAVLAIVQALERSDGKPSRVLTAALARAVGEPGSYTKDEWLAWWKSGASRPRAIRPSGEPDDEDAPPPIKVPR